MIRFVICLSLVVCLGCSRETNAITEGKPNVELENGGGVKNLDRDKTQAFFVALAKVQSAAEEEKLLTEFGAWLKGKQLKIEVEVKNGKHFLTCPFFPPVTPWVSHSFRDIKNLELLPVSQSQ